jgi:hypothetical protein
MPPNISKSQGPGVIITYTGGLSGTAVAWFRDLLLCWYAYCSSIIILYYYLYTYQKSKTTIHF